MGLKYFNLILNKTSGTIDWETHLTNIKLYLNGRLFWDLSAVDLNKLNEYYGMVDSGTTVQVIPFELWDMMDQTPKESTAINTLVPGPDKKMIEAVRLELTFASATNPVIEVTADVAPSTVEGPGAVRRLFKATETPAGAAEYSYINWITPSSELQFIRAIYLAMSANDITRIRVLGPDGTEYQNWATAALDYWATEAGRVATLWNGVADFCLSNTPNGLYDTLKCGKPEFKITFDGAGTLTALIDAIGTI
jgi:hypothetical protein